MNQSQGSVDWLALNLEPGMCGLGRVINYRPGKYGHSNSCTESSVVWTRHGPNGFGDQSSGYRMLYALSKRCENDCYV